MSTNKRILWVNGSFSEESRALLPAESKGLMYGAGCFETLIARSGKFLHLDRHLHRLEEGLEYLGGRDVNHALREGKIRPVLEELIQRNGLAEELALVRIQIALGGGRGYGISPENDFHILISADPNSHERSSSRLTVSDIRAVPKASRPSHLKLSNSLHYMQAMRTAVDAGFDDAILLTTDGFLAETAISNLFWLTGERIYTPDESCDLLPGITRNICLELIELDNPGNLEAGRFKPASLKHADLVWTTNAGRGIHPVSKIDEQTYSIKDSFYDRLTTAFEEYSNSMIK